MAKKINRVYISGPITGVDNYEENFAKAADQLFLLNLHPVNPVTIAHDHDQSYESFMRVDLMALLSCDYIYFLDGWEHSRGAVAEGMVAQITGIKTLTIKGEDNGKDKETYSIDESFVNI